jgi:hypothetical protein
VKGLTKLESCSVTIKANFIEVTSDIIKAAIIGSVDSATNLDYDTITGKNEVELTDYITNVALVGLLSGTDKPVIIILKNVLSLDGLAVKRDDEKDNVLPITFTAHMDPSTPTVLPYEIRYPKLT